MDKRIIISTLNHIVLAAGIFLFAFPACAHKSSDSYLTIKVNNPGMTGQWDIALRDLDFAIGLDADGDNAITWAELRKERTAVEAYAFANLRLVMNGVLCKLNPTDYLVDHHTDGAYGVLQFTIDCPKPDPKLVVDYQLLFDLDPQHRGLLRLDYQNTTQTAVLSPHNSQQTLEFSKAQPLATFVQYLQEGIWHIGLGFDHILFLLSLLLPAVLQRDAKGWQPVNSFSPAWVEVVKIVTAFTLTHSITLSLAVFGFIELPSRWVESAIAASVIVAAINNVYPLIDRRRWLMAFCFGLIHGLGFANVLTDLRLPQGALLLALLAFNVGVEIGQLAIVSAFVPPAYFFRRSGWYQIGCVKFGSISIIVVATLWLLERTLNLKLMDF